MENDELTLRGLADVIRRQIALIGTVSLLGIGIASVYLLLATPVFTASTLVLVDPGRNEALDQTGPIATSRAQAESRIESEVEILRSDAVALSVVQNANLVADPEFGPALSFRHKLTSALGISTPVGATGHQLLRQTVDRFKSSIEINRRGLTYVISIAVSSNSAERAAELSNALARAYIEQGIAAKIDAAQEAGDVLDLQISSARRTLEYSEVELNSFLDRTLAEADAGALGSDVEAMRLRLNGFSSARDETRAQLAVLEQAMIGDQWETVVASLEVAALDSLLSQRDQLQRRLGSISEGSASLDLTAELDRLEARLEREATVRVAALEDELMQLETSMEQTQQELRSAVFRSELPSDIVADIFAVNQKAESARAQYQSLLSRRLEVEVDAGLQLADSRIVSPALVPISPSEPNAGIVLAGAAAVAITMGLGLAFIREYTINGVTTPEQLLELTGRSVQTTIPAMPAPKRESHSIADIVVETPMSAYAESMRRLRVFLNASETPVQGGRVIQVTSAVPDEGKSTTALALARTFAISGQKTLLIDADLRRPSLHHHLGTSARVGLLDFLRSSTDDVLMKDFTGRDPKSELTVAIGREQGMVPTDRFLAEPKFAQIVAEARTQFDVVILDTPPVLPVVDGMYIAKLAHTVLFLAKWSSTSQRDISRATGLMRSAIQENCEFVSVLTHDCSRTSSGYDGYYN